jgi:hypothetical protein
MTKHFQENSKKQKQQQTGYNLYVAHTTLMLSSGDTLSYQIENSYNIVRFSEVPMNKNYFPNSAVPCVSHLFFIKKTVQCRSHLARRLTIFTVSPSSIIIKLLPIIYQYSQKKLCFKVSKNKY